LTTPDQAYYAALRRNEPALDAIASALGLMQAATRAQRHREDADFAFHCAIAEASNNHYYLSSLQALTACLSRDRHAVPT
jgi:GntR family transcriptional regulator, transcriptional repressor for pyruvate dehydrogenase complex